MRSSAGWASTTRLILDPEGRAQDSGCATHAHASRSLESPPAYRVGASREVYAMDSWCPQEMRGRGAAV